MLVKNQYEISKLDDIASQIQNNKKPKSPRKLSQENISRIKINKENWIDTTPLHNNTLIKYD